MEFDKRRDYARLATSRCSLRAKWHSRDVPVSLLRAPADRDLSLWLEESQVKDSILWTEVRLRGLRTFRFVLTVRRTAHRTIMDSCVVRATDSLSKTRFGTEKLDFLRFYDGVNENSGSVGEVRNARLAVT